MELYNLAIYICAPHMYSVSHKYMYITYKHIQFIIILYPSKKKKTKEKNEKKIYLDVFSGNITSARQDGSKSDFSPSSKPYLFFFLTKKLHRKEKNTKGKKIFFPFLIPLSNFFPGKKTTYWNVALATIFSSLFSGAQIVKYNVYTHSFSGSTSLQKKIWMATNKMKKHIYLKNIYTREKVT